MLDPNRPLNVLDSAPARLVSAANSPKRRKTWPVAALIAIAILIVVGLGRVVVLVYFALDPEGTAKNIRAYKVPSISMCPTICTGERILADADAYDSKAPQRGDIVLVRTHFSEALFIKRVIGISGDSVREGAGGEILVNGKPLPAIPNCGKPKITGGSEGLIMHFAPVTVPAGQFFVIGDNLRNSFDSRATEFGYIAQDELRGRPLYLYWSLDFSRIGCRVR